MVRTSLLFAALLMTACGESGESFRDGVPTRETVEVRTPGTEGQALVAGPETQAMALGQTSELYLLTRGATRLVNGGTAALLALLEAIVEHRPTSVSDGTAVWGPHSESLSPNAWRLTVTRTDDHAYSWVMEARPRSADDSAWRAVLSGTHAVATDAQGERRKGFGTGTLLIDWDAMQTLPEHDGNVGSAEVAYARPGTGAGASVEAHFRQVREEGQPQVRVDADYRYQATPGAGGEFEFVMRKSLDARPAPEDIAVRSRWTEDGAGRSDVKLAGGDFGPLSATLSECWDGSFDSQYLAASWDAGAGYGSAEAGCVFPLPVYSSL